MAKPLVQFKSVKTESGTQLVVKHQFQIAPVATKSASPANAVDKSAMNNLIRKSFVVASIDAPPAAKRLAPTDSADAPAFLRLRSETAPTKSTTKREPAASMPRKDKHPIVDLEGP